MPGYQVEHQKFWISNNPGRKVSVLYLEPHIFSIIIYSTLIKEKKQNYDGTMNHQDSSSNEICGV